MIKILVIDDEKIYHNMIIHALKAQDYQIETALNGIEGIKKARTSKPDLIITDVMMPKMNGYEVTSILRREDKFAHIPILVLTAQADMQAKLEAFEAGADDYLSKPFVPKELVIRIEALLRHAKRVNTIRKDTKKEEKSRLIAVHSLRGGIGCSSLAVNLSLGIFQLWKKPTVLLDLTMTAGQVALMLNASLKRTWADLARFSAGSIDLEAINSVINQHESGLSFIPAPTFPSEATPLAEEMLSTTLKMLREEFSYIIADLPHDFNQMTLSVLDEADLILLLVAPEMSSIRAAAAALDTYKKLDYPPEKIKLVLSAIMPRSDLSKEKIEDALAMSVTIRIPYVANKFVHAINYGNPFITENPEDAVTGLLEDFAFLLSQKEHKKNKPSVPSKTWRRVYKRYVARRKK